MSEKKNYDVVRIFLVSCYKIQFLLLTVMHCISLILYDLPKINVTISDDDSHQKSEGQIQCIDWPLCLYIQDLNCNWLSLLEFDLMLAIWEPHFILGKLRPKRLTSSKCTSFHQYLTTALLESAVGGEWP